MLCTQVVACVCLVEIIMQQTLLCVTSKGHLYICAKLNPGCNLKPVYTFMFGRMHWKEKLILIHSWLNWLYLVIVTAIYTRFSQQNQYNAVATDLVATCFKSVSNFSFLNYIELYLGTCTIHHGQVNQISQLFCKIVLMFMHLLHWELDNKVYSIVIVLMGSLLAVDTLSNIYTHICIHFGT